MKTFKAHRRQMLWGPHSEGLESSMRSAPRGPASTPLESAPALESGWKNKEEGELEAEVQARGRGRPLLAKSRGWGGEVGSRKLTLVAVARGLEETISLRNL